MIESDEMTKADPAKADKPAAEAPVSPRTQRTIDLATEFMLHSGGSGCTASDVAVAGLSVAVSALLSGLEEDVAGRIVSAQSRAVGWKNAVTILESGPDVACMLLLGMLTVIQQAGAMADRGGAENRAADKLEDAADKLAYAVEEIMAELLGHPST